jgi:hypothetical protein
MRKTCVLLFSLITISASLYAAWRPSYLLHLLFDLSEPLFMVARLSIATLVLLYAFWPEIRTSAMRLMMGLMGVGLLTISLGAFVSPTFFGYFRDYIPIGDVFIAMEGGVLSLLLAIELPISRPHLKAPSLDWSRLASLPVPFRSQPKGA